jgi:hypothetical protein
MRSPTEANTRRVTAINAKPRNTQTRSRFYGAARASYTSVLERVLHLMS